MGNVTLFVAFCGMDGVGKTTQVTLLEQKLRRSYKVKRVWIRSPHTLAYFIWRFFNIFGYDVPPINGSLNRLIWSVIEIVSIMPRILIDVYLPKALGFTLIGERYVVDSIATMSCYFLKDPKFIHSRASNFLLRFMPPCTIPILLDSNIVSIMERRLTRNSLHDEPVRLNPQIWLDPNKYSKNNPYEYIAPHQQREMYLELARKVRAHIIETSDLSVDEVHRIVLKKISEDANITKEMC